MTMLKNPKSLDPSQERRVLTTSLLRGWCAATVFGLALEDPVIFRDSRRRRFSLRDLILQTLAVGHLNRG